MPGARKKKTWWVYSVIHVPSLLSQRIEDAKNKAEEYLLKNFQSTQSTFTLALVNYALALARSNQPGARSAFTALKSEALVKGTAQWIIFSL